MLPVFPQDQLSKKPEPKTEKISQRLQINPGNSLADHKVAGLSIQSSPTFVKAVPIKISGTEAKIKKQTGF